MTPTLNLHPDTNTLRQFGYVGLLGFGLLAVAALTESLIFSMGLGSARLPVALSLACAALTCLLFSLTAPQLNKPIYVGLSVLTYPIGLVVSYVVMAVLFFLIIGPIGLILRGLGKDPLHRRLAPDARTYWNKVSHKTDPESYFRQF